MRVLVTGAAGFIGFHTANALLAQGHKVIGVDNLNDYYDVKLKQARLDRLTPHATFSFHRLDITRPQALDIFLNRGVTHILHLAAQAGVRYSLENPQAYIDANVTGQLAMLDLARRIEGLQHFVYASSSSVYGGNTKVPFAVGDPVNLPVSPYAATKRAGELLATTYAHLYSLPCTGLRFFTVYGPWGRPDMAYFDFTRRILAGLPIKVFNKGEMRRDFTHIDDIVSGAIAALTRPPQNHALYNLGNSKAERLTDFIQVLEKATGKQAVCDFQPMQPGDVPATFADISSSTRELGFKPTMTINEGLPRFVEWYKSFYGVA